MFHTVYKTTNIIDGMFYIGKHSTTNINDSYLGSGKYITRAIKKYGRENFIKEILFVFDDEEECLLKESEILSSIEIPSSSCYNICPVGTGQKQAGIPLNHETKQKIIKNNGMRGKTHSEDARKKISAAHKGKPSWHKGRKKSEETKHRMSQAQKGRFVSEETKHKISEAGKGRNNSNYGKMWITDGVNNLKILKEDIIPSGWYKGRSFMKGYYRVRG